MLLFLAACATEEAPEMELAPITDAQATAAAAELLCEAASNAGIACEASGTGAQVGDHRVETRVSITGFVFLPGQTLGIGSAKQQLPGEVQISATLELSVDGAVLATLPATHAASDSDPMVARAKVQNELIQRWMVGHGLAVLDAANGQEEAPALAALGMKVAPRDAGPFRAYAAYPMVSGVGLDPSTGGKLGPNVGSMLDALDPYVEDLEPGFHLVHVTAKLGGAGGPGECGIMPPVVMTEGASVSMVRLEGEVLVDGTPVGTICSLSEPVAWPLPQGSSTIEWQQVAVLVPAPEEPSL